MLPTKLTPYQHTSTGVPALCRYSTADCRVFHARSIGFSCVGRYSYTTSNITRFFFLSSGQKALVVTMDPFFLPSLDQHIRTHSAGHYFRFRIFVNGFVGWLVPLQPWRQGAISASVMEERGCGEDRRSVVDPSRLAMKSPK